MQQNVSLNDFKTNCFKLAQQVCDKQLELVLTKHGKPLVKVVPLSTSNTGKLNMLQGTAIMTDDLIQPVQVVWDNNDSVESLL